MNPKKLSILIPAYNEQDYIETCLKPLVDIQEQYKNQNIEIEIIVCDNNSTDKTAELVKKYTPRVTLVTETMKGAHAARQKAFTVSTGDIVITLDADCIVDDAWIEHGLQNFQNPNVVSVAGLCEFSKDYSSAWAVTGAQRYLFPTLHFLTTKIIKKGGMMLAGNAWFRRDILEKIGGFDTSFEFYGDDAHTASEISRKKESSEIMIYDPKLIVYTSSRRYQKIGFWKTMYYYIMNYIWVKLFNKNYH